MDTHGERLKRDLLASLQQLINDVAAGDIYEANVELDNNVRRHDYRGPTPADLISDQPVTLANVRTAKIEIRWRDVSLVL